MNRWLKWLGAAVLLLLLAGAVSAAAAAANPEVRFCWEVEGKEVSVTLFEKKDHSQYLFLPGALKGKDPVVRIDQDVSLIWGEDTYSSGSVFPAERYLGGDAQQVSFSNGRKLGAARVLQGSAIPSMFFSMSAEDFNRINKGTKFDILGEAELLMLAGDGSVDAAGKVPSFKTHGNSTFFAAKKPFQFKLAHKESLAGMERNKTWMLLANWFDISLIRNQLTFDLCREVGLTATPDCRQVDLYVNGAYNGTYLLSEKVQLKKGRLEITDLEETLEALNGKDAYDKAAFKKGNGKVVTVMKWFDVQEPEDVSGGYLLEIEKALQFSQMNNGAGFVTDNGMCIVIKEPTHAGYRCAQYVAKLVNDFHHAVLRKDGMSRSTGRTYSSYIDMRSFALKIIIEEFSANYDVRAASQYMYKDADSVDGRLYAGPGWDYDLSYGNKDDGTRNPLKKDYVFRRSSSDVYIYHWLLTHDDFRLITRQLYEEVFLPAAEVAAGRREPAKGSPLKSVKAYQDEIRESADMNFTRWSARAIPDIWNDSGRTFEASGAFVDNWVNVRMDMLTESWLLDD